MIFIRWFALRFFALRLHGFLGEQIEINTVIVTPPE
jgi:hypothetical protein